MAKFGKFLYIRSSRDTSGGNRRCSYLVTYPVSRGIYGEFFCVGVVIGVVGLWCETGSLSFSVYLQVNRECAWKDSNLRLAV